MLSPCKDRRLPLPEMRKCLERGSEKEMNEHFVGLTIKKIDINGTLGGMNYSLKIAILYIASYGL